MQEIQTVTVKAAEKHCRLFFFRIFFFRIFFLNNLCKSVICAIVRQIPKFNHTFNRRDKKCVGTQLFNANSKCAYKFAVNVNRTATHTLQYATGFIN